MSRHTRVLEQNAGRWEIVSDRSGRIFGVSPAGATIESLQIAGVERWAGVPLCWRDIEANESRRAIVVGSLRVVAGQRVSIRFAPRSLASFHGLAVAIAIEAIEATS